MLCKKDGKAQQKIDIIFTEYSIFIAKNLSFSDRCLLPQKCEGVKHQFWVRDEFQYTVVIGCFITLFNQILFNNTLTIIAF